MNIPQNIIHNRKIISSNVYNYHQSLSNRLNENNKYLEKKNMINYNKDKIIKWFCGLNFETRLKICSIYNNWLTKIIFQLATYVKYDPVIEFTPMNTFEELLKNRQSNNYNDYRNSDDYNNFDIFFRGENKVKKGTGTPDSKELQKIKEKRDNETEFMNEIRFLSLDEFNDTITMSLDLINRPEQIIKYFNFFSENQCFTSKIEKIKNCNFSFPKWIYGYNSYSIYQLLVIFFEQKISIYYQIYLIENKIPEFDIDTKITYLLKKKSNIEDYLLKKITKNDSNNNYIDNESDKYDFIDEQKILNALESQKKIIQYYEIKTDLVYSCAFGSSLNENFYDDNSKKKEFNTKIKELKRIFKKNIYDFVNKISFIEMKDAFLYPNFLCYILYQQLIEQSSNQNWDELLIEDENKVNYNKSLKNKKRKKNKKRRNKKNKNKLDNNNNNLEDNNSSIKCEIINIDQEKEKNINESNNNNGINGNDDDNKEEEIEEIPSDIIEPKESKEEIIEVELCNNVGSINDINNSTVSSSNTNRSSKDPYFFEPKFNNFFRGDKKEGEILKKDLNDELEHNVNINEKLEIEDISENDISEETINNDDIYSNINQNQLSNKKKKKNKRKNKKNKTNNNNNSINKNQEKEKDNNLKNNNENIKLIKEESKEKDKVKKEEISEETKDIKKIQKENEINIINETTNETNCENENNNKIEKNEKSEKSNKVKKNKEFFLFPVCNSNKKKGNKKENKKNKEKDITKNDTPKSSNENKREMMTQTENISNNENPNKNISSQNENIKKKNILIKTNVSEIEFNSNKNNNKKDIEENTSEEKNNIQILNYNIESVHSYEINNYNSQFCNFNIYYLSQQPQPQYPNILFYPNCNDSLLIFQNEFFSILDKEILDYEKNVDNNLNKIKIYREQILNNIKKFISKILYDKYNFEFLLYGSYSTGLSIEISDIDILIKFEIKNKSKNINTEINSQQNIENILSLLEKALEPNKKKLNISQINPIYTASVPVLKIECILKDIIPKNIQKELSETYLFNFENEILKLNLDFTFHEVNDIKEMESIPSQEILSYIKDKINVYPNIRPNLLVLKRYMQIKKLNSSFHGGISSYSLFLLLYSLYKQIYGKNDIGNAEYLKTQLGRELLNFFSFYGILDFENNCIDAKSDSPIYRMNSLHKNNILLVDPITGLNVAKSTFRIEQIKYSFNNAAMIINNFFYKKMNTLKVNEDYKILNQLFNPIFNYNNIFIPGETL